MNSRLTLLTGIVCGLAASIVLAGCSGDDGGGGEETAENGELVFVRPETVGETPATALYVIDPEGDRRAERLTSPDTDRETDADPSWSPDGSRVAFIRSSAAGASLVVVGRDGEAPEDIGRPGNNYAGPAWSPDGTRIACFEQSEEGWNVIVTSVDGETRRTVLDLADDPLGAGPAIGGLDWAPDGSLAVAYDPRPRNEALEYAISIVGEDGTGEERLASGSNPSWSPDSEEIAFETDAGIAVMSRDGGDVRTLLEGEVLRPVWSPDGERIVVTDAAGLTILDTNGDNPDDLVTRAADADWAPAR